MTALTRQHFDSLLKNFTESQIDDSSFATKTQKIIERIYYSDGEITRFILPNNKSSDLGTSLVKSFAEALKNNDKLEEIDLTNSAHDTSSLIELIDVLIEKKDSLPLKRLTLNNNQLKGNALRKISEFLSNNTTLETLNIEIEPNNNLSEDSIKGILNALKKNTKLQDLNFVPNSLFDQITTNTANPDESRKALQQINEQLELGPDGRAKNLRESRQAIELLGKGMNDEAAENIFYEEQYLINQYKDDEKFKRIHKKILDSFNRQLDKYMPDLVSNSQGKELSKGFIEQYAPLAKHCLNFVNKVTISPSLIGSGINLDPTQLSEMASELINLDRAARQKKIDNLNQHIGGVDMKHYESIKEVFSEQLSAMSAAIAISYLEPLKNVSEVKSISFRKNDTRVYDLITEVILKKISGGETYKCSTNSLWDHTLSILHEGMHNDWSNRKGIRVKTNDDKDWYLRGMLIKCNAEVYECDEIRKAIKNNATYNPELSVPNEEKYQKGDKYLPIKVPASHTVISRYYTEEGREQDNAKQTKAITLRSVAQNLFEFSQAQNTK